MKTLINNIKTFLETAITAEDIRTATVFKGLHEDPSLIPNTQFPYIAIDDGGERVEDINSNTAQNRIYSIILEMGVKVYDRETAIDDILDFCNEVKTEVEKEANRQKDSHIWGVSIRSFDWEAEGYFFRGRTVIIDYISLEDRYNDY